MRAGVQTGLDYKGFLAEALSAEWSGRHGKGVEMRLSQAHFPVVKTLGQFDFGFQPSLDKKVLRELSGMGFLERSENVIFLGPPGVGKSHLAIALGVKAVEAGYRVLFLTLEELLTRLMRAQSENRLERMLQQLVYPRLLILDEIGYLLMSREEASLFFRFLCRRYEKASLVLTSNKSFLDWGGHLWGPGPGHRHFGPASPLCDDRQYQGRIVPAQGKKESGAFGIQDRSSGGTGTP